MFVKSSSVIFSVALSTVISAANPFPFMCRDRRKNKPNSFRQLILNYGSGCSFPSQTSVVKKGIRGNQRMSPCSLFLNGESENVSSSREAGNSTAGASIRLQEGHPSCQALGRPHIIRLWESHPLTGFGRGSRSFAARTCALGMCCHV